MVVGAPTMTNSDFLAEIYGEFEAGTYGWVCSFRADPSSADPGVWSGRPYRGLPAQAQTIDRATQDNTYFCTSTLRPTEQGETVRRKDAFHQLKVLVLDDVQIEDVRSFSYSVLTSPGNRQVGIRLDPADPDTRDLALLDRVMQALASRRLIKADKSGNNAVRYVRLPGGTNTKPRPAGDWEVQLEYWNPNTIWSLDDACAAIGLDLDNQRIATAISTTSTTAKTGQGTHAGEMIAGLIEPNPSQRVYHDNITRLAASLVSGGMFPGAAVEFLRSLMEQIKPGDPQEVARWQSRYDEIDRAVRSAEKFAPEERKPPQITVNLSLAQSKEEIEAPAGELSPMDWGALQGTEPEPTAWRWDGWLPEGTVTLLSANGGVGKSNVSLQLAVSLAHGMSLFDVQASSSRVLVLSGEDEAKTVHFRVANICAELGLDIASLAERVIVYDLTKADCVLWRDGNPTKRMQWLADTVVRTKAGVVMIDNASDVFADNENDRTAVRGFMRCLNLIAGETQAAVLLLAHVDKASVRGGAGLDSNTTFSGSTAWNNSARSRWAMVRDEQTVVLRHEKCNFGPLQEEIRLEFDPGSKTFKRFGSTPGLKAAATLMRNQHRAAILKMIGQAADAGANLSMRANAPSSNIFNVLRDEPEMPRIDRREFFGILRDLEREQLITEQDYRKANRMTGLRVVLTDAGRTRVALGSGAPPAWAQRQEEDAQ